MTVMKGVTIGGRALTKVQRRAFERNVERIYNKVLQILGKEAEEIVKQDMHGSEDHVISSAAFKLGEVVYHISITGKREEESA